VNHSKSIETVPNIPIIDNSRSIANLYKTPQNLAGDHTKNTKTSLFSKNYTATKLQGIISEQESPSHVKSINNTTTVNDIKNQHMKWVSFKAHDENRNKRLREEENPISTSKEDKTSHTIQNERHSCNDWEFCDLSICKLNRSRVAFKSPGEFREHMQLHRKNIGTKIIAMNCQRMKLSNEKVPYYCILSPCWYNDHSFPNFYEIVKHTKEDHNMCSNEWFRSFFVQPYEGRPDKYDKLFLNKALTSFVINVRQHESNQEKDRRNNQKSKVSSDTNNAIKVSNHVSKFLSDARSNPIPHNRFVDQSLTYDTSRIESLYLIANSGSYVCQICKSRQELNNRDGHCFIQWRFSAKEELKKHNERQHLLN